MHGNRLVEARPVPELSTVILQCYDFTHGIALVMVSLNPCRQRVHVVHVLEKAIHLSIMLVGIMAATGVVAARAHHHGQQSGQHNGGHPRGGIITYMRDSAYRHKQITF